jgi:hypothetical protein
MLCCDGCRVAIGDNDTDLEPDEFGGNLGDPLVAPLRPAVLDHDVSTFDPAEFAHPLHKGGGPSASGRGGTRPQKADSRRFRRLLRARGKRPGNRSKHRVHEKCDEISALHVPLRSRVV